MSDTVTIEGLDGLVRALKRIDRGTRLETTRRLRRIGRVVADEAKQEAAARGLHESGQLIGRIHPRVRRGSVYVEDSARRVSKSYPAGYNYPKRYEYQQGGARAFMRPALAHAHGRVLAEFEQFLSWVESEFRR